MYIVMFLLIAPLPSSAKLISRAGKVPSTSTRYYIPYVLPLADTIIKKRPPNEDEKKIKEVSKAKRQSKPAKIDDANNQPKQPRERRPEGMERPPEIPRRNGN